MAAPGALIQSPYLQFFDDDGHPLSGGTVEIYLAGTSTPSPLYSDADLLVSLGAEPDLDGAGRLAGYLDSALAYKMVVKDADGEIVRTQDNMRFASPGNSSTELDRFVIESI